MKLQRICGSLPKPQFIAELAASGKGLPWYGELLLGILAFVVFNVGMIAGGALIALFFMAIGVPSSALPPWGPEVLDLIFCYGLGILLVFLLARLVQRRGLHSFGFVRKQWLSEYAAGLGAGLAAFSLVLLLAALTGAVRFTGLSPSFSPVGFLLLLAGYGIQGMGEEVALRGFMLPSFCRRNALWLGALFSALVFSAAHLGNAGGMSFWMLLNVTLVGVCLAVAVLKRGGIWLACGFHTAWNFVQGSFYGLPVSGDAPDMSLLSFEMASENALLTGGAFGLEASIFTTLVLAVVFVFLLALKPVDMSAHL